MTYMLDGKQYIAVMGGPALRDVEVAVVAQAPDAERRPRVQRLLSQRLPQLKRKQCHSGALAAANNNPKLLVYAVPN